jgi:hypothetical protein
MPYGFFTIEQWKRPSRGAKPAWVPIAHLDARNKLSDAFQLLEQRNKPGFFRVVQTQRVIWAEMTSGKLHLRKWHSGSPDSLARGAKAFDRDGGRYPVAPRNRRTKK